MRYTLREWQSMKKDKEELIVQASSMACDDAWQSFPIGMSWQYGRVEEQIGSHENLLLCAIHTHTDQARRGHATVNRMKIIENLSRNSFSNHILDSSEYFRVLPTFKFVVSPEGNGVDCHRHYEALMAGCIPIIEHHPLIELKYRGCPILYTTDYSEITPAYLEAIWLDFNEREWDFSRLFLSYYDEETQNQIRACGNFWMNRMTGHPWY